MKKSKQKTHPFMTTIDFFGSLLSFVMNFFHWEYTFYADTVRENVITWGFKICFPQKISFFPLEDPFVPQ